MIYHAVEIWIIWMIGEGNLLPLQWFLNILMHVPNFLLFQQNSMQDLYEAAILSTLENVLPRPGFH